MKYRSLIITLAALSITHLSLPVQADEIKLNSTQTSWYQSRIKFETGRASVVTFDWTCSSAAKYPSWRLNHLIIATMKSEKISPFGRWGDRAVALDLNGDRINEYFVPLDCGAVGNCIWGVFAVRPLRKLGVINGQYIYLHRTRARWPELITYGHVSAVEGSLTAHRMRRGRYRKISPSVPINHGEFALQIQGGMGSKMPRFLKQATPLCEPLGFDSKEPRSAGQFPLAENRN